MAPKVLYSYYYDDVFRVQLVRQMGVLKGQPLLAANDWKEVEDAGTEA